MRLIELNPGVPQYIPHCHNLDDAHSLVQALGMKTAATLSKQYGGENITLPNCKLALAKIRHRKIRQARQEGYSQTEAALLFGLTPRQIRNIDNAVEKPVQNLSLF